MIGEHIKINNNIKDIRFTSEVNSKFPVLQIITEYKIKTSIGNIKLKKNLPFTLNRGLTPR
ncbi:hypothetical protein CQA01_01720 [Cyclobacterium qasimii]|uniref:Uncharacterized protein n=1 Tax=Cyclobacterium qasimii TaxID=1350429 RepID=A0A512C5Z1_9BACT|nr:hypothetical protein CQA01_01720 [Cyclobacterium qasimii]